jgi:hypothetical protein
LNYKKLLLIFIIIIISIKAFSQSSDFPKIMYVNSLDGLRVRAATSLDSARIGAYLHGERIIVYERNDTPVNIDGITDYWYQTHRVYYFGGKYYNTAWVFGGYLSESLPLDVPVFLGLWEEENNNHHVYYFSPTTVYKEGIKGSEWFNDGTWKLNENTLVLITNFGAYEKLDNPIIEEFYIAVDNRNHITLQYPDGKLINLMRSNDCDVYY